DRDEVTLKDGRVLKGRVVYEDEKEILLRVGTREQSIPFAEIGSLRSVSRSLAKWVDRHRGLGKGDRAARVQLAKACAEEGLEKEARLEWLGALALEPSDPEANEALGHRRGSGGAWQLPYRNGWSPLGRLEKVRADWNDAWEFESEHYRVKSNLPWPAALDAAFDLEFFLHDFYRAFGRELHLRGPGEPMAVDLHRNRDSYPEIGGNRPAYFDRPENCVRVSTGGTVHPEVLFHEATHQLLYTTAARARGGTGEIPDWLNEGLADYVASGVSGEAGQRSFSTGARAAHHFREHAEAEKPYDLSRVLQFEAGDFVASSKASLKYAQAYTLVHFCLHGAEGKYRERFLGFVEGAYRGQGSSTDFKKALGEREDVLERAWHAYARGSPGK
ncbi:MAG: DUF1570 domain-containing protein, partial [Planctomycetota bacterium]